MDIEVPLVASLIILIWYVLADFSYSISGDFLIMKWKILKFLRIWKFKIRLTDILEVRPYKRWDVFGALMFGNLFSVRKGAVIVLRRYIFASNPFFTKKVVITPSNTASFIEEINSKLLGMDAGSAKDKDRI